MMPIPFAGDLLMLDRMSGVCSSLGATMKFSWNQIQLRGAFALAVICSPLLTACAKSNAPAPSAKSIPVPIHGVNYTAEPFSFVVIDPQDPKNYGGGETINSYGAGGTMCCYSLPAQWRPGLKVEIAETYWLPVKADKSLPEVRKKHVVEIPPYSGGKAGELWVLRGPSGEMSIVSSDLQPDHRDWTGGIKGWPVPSVEYQRKIHDTLIVEAQNSVDLYTGLVADMDKNPSKMAQEQWEFTSASENSILKPYRGSTDPAYREMLKKDYALSLERAAEKLKRYKVTRP